MRKYNYYIKTFLFGAVSIFGLSSCNKWLDIKPQTQIESDVAFEKESGFQDALTGVYIKMSSTSLYAKELTFGMVDGLAGQFNGLSTGHQYYSTTNYIYTDSGFISKSDAAFAGAYNAIANINNIIVNINSKDPNLFSGVNYHTIRGELYGLRAMLHFDLIRLFGSSMASQGATLTAIPYVDTIGTKPITRLTTRAFLDRILADLSIAATELKQSDPIIPANAANASTYLRDRAYKFNYYAVKALQARAYLYAGDKTNALPAALEVINSNVFGWTPSSEIIAGNRVFTQELIFNLTISNLSTITSSYFDAQTSGAPLLSRSNTDYNLLFPDFDYRKEHLTATTADGNRRYSIKFNPTTNGSAAYVNRMPVIRKSEMYFIAAECVASSSPQQAATYLNEVKQNRNATLLALNLTSTAIEAEITLEYRREFIGEGQLFYYYKRKNISQPPGIAAQMSDATYVLPRPAREINYGL